MTYSDITADGIRITKTLADVTDGIKNGELITKLDITDPKTSSSVRTVPVDPVVLDELQIHRKWHLKEMMQNNYRSDYIFTTDSGEFYDPKNLDRALARYYKRIGITPKPLHTFRHTYGSRLSKCHIPIETTASLMGHSDISTTYQYYVNIHTESKAEAAMVFRLEA